MWGTGTVGEWGAEAHVILSSMECQISAFECCDHPCPRAVWECGKCGKCGQLRVRLVGQVRGEGAAARARRGRVGSCHFSASWPRIVRAGALRRGISAALRAVAAAKSDHEHGRSRAA